MHNLKLSNIDCECSEDFAQYYKNRYFALPDEDGTLLPASCLSGAGPYVHLHIVKKGQPTGPAQFEWAEVVKKGKFGIPLLGNTLYGDSYKYLWMYARRESVKGISVDKMQQWAPDTYGLFQTVKTRLTETSISGSVELLHHVYNPKFFSFDDAIENLENGKRVGCPLDSKTGLHLHTGCPFICVSYRFRTVGYLASNTKFKFLNGFEYLGDILKMSLPGNISIS